ALSIDLTANFWFSTASVFLLTAIVSIITDRVIEPRLGPYTGDAQEPSAGASSSDEARGLRYAAIAVVATVVFFGLLTLPAGAPLRNPETGGLLGDSPFMNGLIVAITLLFLAAGAAYGWGARTITNATQVIQAMEKATAGLGSL